MLSFESYFWFYYIPNLLSHQIKQFTFHQKTIVLQMWTFISWWSSSANIQISFLRRPLDVLMKTFKHWFLVEVRLLHQVVLKLAPNRSHHTGPGNPEGQEEPDHVVEDLDPAEEGEASEEAHCASNEAQLGLGGHLYACFVWIRTVSFFTLTSLSIWL